MPSRDAGKNLMSSALENLVVCGPSWTGKTFLLERPSASTPSNTALKVAWFTLEDLGVLLRRHRADDTVTKAIARVLRADLVVVDDIGLLPVAQDAAKGQDRFVHAAYEKPSLAHLLQPAPRAFDELMPKTPGHRHRRPARAPRARLSDQRRERAPVPSPHRTKGEPVELNTLSR